MDSKIPDIADVYSSFLLNVPSNSEQEFVFSQSCVPKAPTRVKTSRLVVKKSYQFYNESYRADRLDAYMSKNTCRQVGTLLLSVLFHPEPTEVWLELVHPESDIKSLVVECPCPAGEKLRRGYNSRPHALVHFPEEPSQMFDCLCDLADPDKVEFRLTNAEEFVGQSEEIWTKRDVIKGVGNDRATAFLGEFLLNAGRPESVALEHALDSFSEVVYQQSAELRLWLPGAFGWCHDFCSDLE